jgi:hypothetical protein
MGPAVFLASEASDFVNGHIIYNIGSQIHNQWEDAVMQLEEKFKWNICGINSNQR